MDILNRRSVQSMKPLSPSSFTRISISLSLFDVIWIILSPFIALGLRGREFLFFGSLPFNPSATFVYSLITILTSIIIFTISGGDKEIPLYFSAKNATNILIKVFVSLTVSVTVAFSVSRLDGVPRLVPIIHGLVLVVGLLSFRLILRYIHEHTAIIKKNSKNNKKIMNVSRVIIIGLDPFAIAAMRLTEKQNPPSCQIVAAFSLQGKYAGRSISGIKILGGADKLPQVIDEYRIHGIKIDEVWVSDASNYFNQEIYDFVVSQLVDYDVITYKLSSRLSLNTVEQGSDLISNITHTNDYKVIPLYHETKRSLDFIIAFVAFCSLLPLVTLVAVVSVIDIGYPFLFWQERLGRYGKNIRIYKIRTLAHPIDRKGRTIPFHNRISKFGKLIRRLRLDEFPQLISIIMGDMSVIGPRPLLKEDQPKNAEIRLFVRPGITGWAQVNGGELLTAEEKNFFDCWYVYHASIGLDLIIFYKTINLLIFGIRRDEQQIIKAGEFYRTLKIRSS